MDHWWVWAPSPVQRGFWENEERLQFESALHFPFAFLTFVYLFIFYISDAAHGEGRGGWQEFKELLMRRPFSHAAEYVILLSLQFIHFLHEKQCRRGIVHTWNMASPASFLRATVLWIFRRPPVFCVSCFSLSHLHSYYMLMEETFCY